MKIVRSENLNNNKSMYNIYDKHRFESVINDCKVTVYFAKKENVQVERNVLENLLDTFENRIKLQMNL